MVLKVRRNRKAERELIERIREKNTKGRDPGISLTDLVYCSRKSYLRLKGETPPPDDDAILTFSFGWAMHWLSERGPEKRKQIEGLWYSPDEIDLALDPENPEKKIVVDFKGTRKSSAKADLGAWPDQLGGYALAEGTNLARLQTLYYVGQYGGKSPVTKSDGTVEIPTPFSPQHRAWDLEYDEAELQGWGRELGRRRRMIEGAKKLEDIPLSEHFDWECKYCPHWGNKCPGGGGERLPWFGAIETQEDIP